MSILVGADEGLDDDGPEFRPPLPPEDRIWRHPAEIGAAASQLASSRSTGRNPWAIGFVSVIGGVLLAGSLMFGAGGVGDEPSRISLRPIATLAPMVDSGATPVSDHTVPPATPALVGIDVPMPGNQTRMGNGLVFTEDGFVVTTASLVAGAADVRITGNDGSVLGGQVIGVDELNDVAVIRVEGLTATTAVLDRSDAATVGQKVQILGAARGVAHSLVPASVTSVEARLVAGACDLHGAIQLDTAVDESEAGAAVVASSGQILGIVTTRQPGSPAVVIPTRTIAWVANQLVEVGQVRHGWMGVEGVTATEAQSEPNAAGGAMVQRVVDASPAQSAGLQADDIVVSIDGEQVQSMSALVVAVREHTPGTTVTIGILRDGEHDDVKVSLSDVPVA